MDIQQMTYFLAVYEAKTFTRAAQDLHITQQGLSKAIQRLEQEFGTPLFLRERHALTPTEFGETFYQTVHPLVLAHQKAADALRQEARRHTAIRLGIGTNVLSVMDGPALLKQFEAEHPEFPLELVHMTDYECEDMLARRQLDVVLSMGPFDPTAFQTVLLVREPIWAVLSDRNPLSAKASVTLEDLSREPIITADPKNKGAEWTRQFFHGAGKDFHPVFQSNDAMTNLKLAQAGRGVLLVPASILPMYENAQGICPRPIENSPQRELFLAYQPQALKRTSTSTFIQFVQAHRALAE